MRPDPANGVGTYESPRLPIELMRAMPPAAADPVRKAVRNVQKVVNGGNAFILRRAIKKR